jgi:hypothetical protein
MPGLTAAVRGQEFAYSLVKAYLEDPDFNKTHGLFWSVLPSPDEVLCGEMLISEEELNMLQMPTLVRHPSLRQGQCARV